METCSNYTNETIICPRHLDGCIMYFFPLLLLLLHLKSSNLLKPLLTSMLFRIWSFLLWNLKVLESGTYRDKDIHQYSNKDDTTQKHPTYFNIVNKSDNFNDWEKQSIKNSSFVYILYQRVNHTIWLARLMRLFLIAKQSLIYINKEWNLFFWKKVHKINVKLSKRPTPYIVLL